MIQPKAAIACLALATCATLAARTNAQPTAVLPEQAPTARLAPPDATASQMRGSFMPAVTRVREGRASLSSRANIRTTHIELGTRSGLVTLDTTRIRRAPSETIDASAARRDRSVSWSVALGYQLQVGENDAVAMAATIGAEKHRSVITTADGHPTGTSTARASLGWQHGGLRLHGGWFAMQPLRLVSALDRAVALSGGSTIVERGYQASASLPLLPLAAFDGRMGLRFVAASVDARDRLALGAAERRDARTSLFLGLRFR